MRKATIVLTLIMLAGASSRKAAACSCACDADYTVERYIDTAVVIVVGRVLDVKPKAADPDPLAEQFLVPLGVDVSDLTTISSCGEEWIHVAVKSQLKGERRAELTLVHTPCYVEFPLQVGGDYLLFGMPSRDGNTVYLSGCSPSAPVARAHVMVKKIRKQLARAS